MKKISVITVNLNNAIGLNKTVDSVINQSAIDNIEWIIIDGGSNDGSFEIIKQIERHIDYYISEHDQGVYNAMNKGLQQAHGEYVIFLNSGDVFANNNVITDFLKSKEYGKYDYCVGMANFVKNDTLLYSKKPLSSTALSGLSLFRNVMVHQAEFIRRERFIKNGIYDERYKICADMKFFFNDVIINSATYASLDILVVNYDCSGISTLHSVKRMEEEEQYLKELLPERIHKDYIKWLKGDSILSKIIIKLEKKHAFLFLLTAFSCILYLPLYVKNLLTYRLKKSLASHNSH